MRIIFLGTTGVHHALLAANIYLEKLKSEHFNRVKGFCDISKDFSGFPIYIGEDKAGNHIYTMGVGKEVLLAKKTIEELVHLLGKSEQDLIVKPISIKGENLLYIISHISNLIRLNHLNFYYSTYYLKKHLGEIEKMVNDFKLKNNL